MYLGLAAAQVMVLSFFAHTDDCAFVFCKLPLIAPGIWAGLLLVFIRSLGEYTISAFLYTASNRPISIAMVNSIFEFDIGLAMAYGALVLAITFIGAGLIRIGSHQTS